MRVQQLSWQLAVVIPLLLVQAASGNQKLDVTDICDVARLTLVRPLDFGDLRIPRGNVAHIHVLPEGGLTLEGDVLILRDPAPGEMELCGPPDQRVAVLVEQPQAEMVGQNRNSAARYLEKISIVADDADLREVAPGRWEGRLPSSGRARVHVGATLYLDGSGRHGEASTNIVMEVMPI